MFKQKSLFALLISVSFITACSEEKAASVKSKDKTSAVANAVTSANSTADSVASANTDTNTTANINTGTNIVDTANDTITKIEIPSKVQTLENINADAKIYSVLFYADWCGSCKVLDPKLKEAQDSLGLSNKKVEFITLDLSNDETKKEAAQIASKLGITPIYEANKGKTGYMALVNGSDKKVITTLNKTTTAAQIAKTIIGSL